MKNIHVSSKDSLRKALFPKAFQTETALIIKRFGGGVIYKSYPNILFILIDYEKNFPDEFVDSDKILTIPVKTNNTIELRKITPKKPKDPFLEKKLKSMINAIIIDDYKYNFNEYDHIDWEKFIFKAEKAKQSLKDISEKELFEIFHRELQSRYNYQRGQDSWNQCTF